MANAWQSQQPVSPFAVSSNMTRRYASCGRTTSRRISKISVRTLDELPVRLTEVNLNRRWVCPTCGLAADPREEPPRPPLAAGEPMNDRIPGGATPVALDEMLFRSEHCGVSAGEVAVRVETTCSTKPRKRQLGGTIARRIHLRVLEPVRSREIMPHPSLTSKRLGHCAGHAGPKRGASKPRSTWLPEKLKPILLKGTEGCSVAHAVFHSGPPLRISAKLQVPSDSRVWHPVSVE